MTILFFLFLKLVLKLINNLIIIYLLPKNLGYLWNYGSLSGLFLVNQFVIGRTTGNKLMAGINTYYKVFNLFDIFIKKQKSKHLNYFLFYFPKKNKRNYSSFLFNLDLKSTKLDIDSDIMNLRLNELIDSENLILFKEDEQNIFEWLIAIRLEILKLFLSKYYNIEIESIIIKENNNTNLYEFYDSKQNILLYFVYFFYRKKLEIIIDNTYYNIFCVYHLFDKYSLEVFNCIMYRCIYIYFDYSNNSFLFYKDVDNTIFNQLVTLDIKENPHKNDIYLYDSLLTAISDLINNKLIFISSEYKNDLDFIIGNKNIKNRFSLKKNYCTIIKKIELDGQSDDLGFELYIFNLQFNKKITNTELVLFNQNSDFIFDFLKSNLIIYNKEFIINYYDFNRHWGNDVVEVVTLDNIIDQKISNSFFEFYQDKYTTHLLYYVYFIDTKIIDLFFNNFKYKVYCLFFFNDKFGCFSDYSNILYTCVYIYYNVSTNSYSFDLEVDNSIFDKLIDEAHPIHQINYSFYKSLLNSIRNLYDYNIIKIPNNYFHHFVIKSKYKNKKSKPKKKSNTLLKTKSKYKTNIRNFHTYGLNYLKQNTFLLGKSALKNITIKSIPTNRISIDELLTPTSKKMFGFLKIKHIELEELNQFFHKDLIKTDFFSHHWLLLHNNIKVVDEAGNIREGYIMTTSTSHKLTGDISKNLKFWCPSFWNENSRLYYHIYFFENTDNFKYVKLKFKIDSNLKFEFVYNFLVTALSKNMTEIRCAKTNTQLFTKDNIQHSKLDLSKYSADITDFNSLYCNHLGLYSLKSTILPTVSETTVEDLNQNNNSEIHNDTNYDDSDINLD